jgi:hypothetical protein
MTTNIERNSLACLRDVYLQIMRTGRGGTPLPLETLADMLSLSSPDALLGHLCELSSLLLDRGSCLLFLFIGLIAQEYTPHLVLSIVGQAGTPVTGVPWKELDLAFVMACFTCNVQTAIQLREAGISDQLTTLLKVHTEKEAGMEAEEKHRLVAHALRVHELDLLAVVLN